jgi:hypothetical protein
MAKLSETQGSSRGPPTEHGRDEKGEARRNSARWSNGRGSGVRTITGDVEGEECRWVLNGATHSLQEREVALDQRPNPMSAGDDQNGDRGRRPSWSSTLTGIRAGDSLGPAIIGAKTWPLLASSRTANARPVPRCVTRLSIGGVPDKGRARGGPGGACRCRGTGLRVPAPLTASWTSDLRAPTRAARRGARTSLYRPY